MEEVKVEDVVEQEALAEEKQKIGLENSEQFGLDEDYEGDSIAGGDGPDCLGPEILYSSKYFINKKTGKILTKVDEICPYEIYPDEETVNINKIYITYGGYFKIYDSTDGCAAAEFKFKENFCAYTRILRHDDGSYFELSYAFLNVDSVRVVEDNGEYLYTEYVNCGEKKEDPDTITRYRFEKEWTETVPSLFECDGPAATGEL